MADHATWKERKTDGQRVLFLDPAPLPRETFTFDMFERGLLLLGIDPDTFLSKTMDLENLPEPSPTKLREFIRLYLSNHNQFAIGEWEPDLVRLFASTVAAHFITDSARNWLSPGRTLKGSGSGIVSIFR